jgi:hypothetical protein
MMIKNYILKIIIKIIIKMHYINYFSRTSLLLNKNKKTIIALNEQNMNLYK